MAKQIRREIYITANGKVAQDVLKALGNYAADLDKQIQKLIADGKADSKECKTLVAVQKSLGKQMKDNVSDMERVDKVMKDLAGSSTGQLKRALSALRREIDRTSESSGKLPQMRQQLKAIQDQIDKNTGAVKKHGGAWNTALKNLTAYVGLFAVFNTIKSKMTDIIRLNLQYSDSLANIRKVSNLSMKSVNELSTMLAKIDSRTSLEGLTQLAYMGSRLGMAKYGTQGLADFAAAADRVNVALKEDLGDEAMLILSKMVETMGEVEKHGGNISKAFDAVSSSIFKLASTSTANGGNIIEFTKRLTGIAKVAHVSTDELLALGSASDALMLMPEVSATAMGKFIQSLWTNYSNIEQMLGMQKNSLKQYMENGQTMQALVEVLKNVSDKNLNSMDAYFKEFGSDGQRMKTAIVTMAQNIGVLEQHLDTSSKAYKEATAVSKEYAIQQQTAQAIMERANNMWEKAFVNPQGIDTVKEIAKVWYDFSKQLTKSQPFLASVKILLWEMSLAVKALIAVLPGLLVYLGTRGLAGLMAKLITLSTGFKFSAIVAAVGHLRNAIMGNTVAMGRLVLQWRALNTAMKANVVGLVLSVVASLGVAIYNLAQKTNKAKSSMEGFDRSLKGVYSAANQAVGEMDAYYRAILKANKGTEVRKVAIKAFNDKFKPYLTNLITEKSAVEDLAKAYNEASKAIRAKVYLQMKENDITKQYAPRAGWALDRLNEYGEVAPDAQHGEDWLQAYVTDTKKKSISDVEKELAKQFGSDRLDEVKKHIQAGRTDFSILKDFRKITDPAYYHDTRDVSTSGDKQLFKALRYVYQQRSADNSMSAIDKKYSPVQDQIDKYLTQGDTVTLTENDDDKDKKPKGDPTTDAKKRANALLANIKAFYEEQRRKYYEWVGEMNKDGEKVSEGQVQQYLSVLEEHEKTATGLARQSIATAGDEWDKFNTELGKDLFQTASETDTRLLRDIGESNIGELHEMFLKLSADMSKETHTSLAENLGALLDEIFKNGAKDLREAAENVVKRQRAIQAILNQHDYTGAVDRTTRSNFDQLDFLRPAQGVNANTDAGLDKMNDAFDKLTEKARNAVAELYAIDPASTDFQQKFLSFLSVANDGFDFSSQSVQNLKALYLELIKYTDQYTAAQKQQYEYAKKVVNQRWKDNRSNKENQDAQYVNKIQKELFGKQTSFLSNLGMANARDPEIEDYKLKMEAAQEYFAFVQKTSKDHELLDEANKARREAELAYMEQVVKSMKDRAAQLGQFLSPVQEFGEAMGEAFAKMSDDAESADEAIKAALKSMIQSFGKKLIEDVNAQMWQGINNSIAKRQARKAEAEVAESRANAEGNITADLEMERGASAEKPLFVNVVNGEKKSDGAEGSGNIGENGGGTGASATPDASGVNGGSGNGGAATERGNGLARTGARMGSSVGNAIVEGATGGDAGAIGASVVGTALDGLMNADFSTKKSGKSKDEKQEEKARKKALKDERKQAKALAKEKEKGLKDQAKATKKYSKEMTKTTEEGNQEQSKGTQMAQNAIVTAVQTAGTMEIQTKKKNDEQVVKSSGKTAQAETTFSMVGAIAKCFEFLGPIAGPIAAAVVVATLNGLLQWAMSSIFGGSGSDSTASAPTANTKLVSGMLTYDQGNISDLKPFFDKEGNMYWAEEDDSEHKGVSLLTQPTATTINGQPSLVAEQGPELVIGRETTRAMMQNDPQLLRTLYQYDKNHSGRHAFDNGNVSDLEPTVGADGQTIWAESVTASNAALTVAVNALLARLQQPITAKVDMYGRGNLYDSMSKAQQFMKGKF